MNETLDKENNYRLCPLKFVQETIVFLQNIDPEPDSLPALKGGVVRACTSDQLPRIEHSGGHCVGPRCAWYDCSVNKYQCAVLSIAHNK